MLSLRTTPARTCPEAERLVIDDLGYDDDGISHSPPGSASRTRPAVPPLLKLLREGAAGARRRSPDEARLRALDDRDRPHGGGGMAMLAQAPVRLAGAARREPDGYFRLPASRTTAISCPIEL